MKVVGNGDRPIEGDHPCQLGSASVDGLAWRNFGHRLAYLDRLGRAIVEADKRPANLWTLLQEEWLMAHALIISAATALGLGNARGFTSGRPPEGPSWARATRTDELAGAASSREWLSSSQPADKRAQSVDFRLAVGRTMCWPVGRPNIIIIARPGAAAAGRGEARGDKTTDDTAPAAHLNGGSHPHPASRSQPQVVAPAASCHGSGFRAASIFHIIATDGLDWPA